MDLNHPLLAQTADDLAPFPPSYPQLQRLDRSVICQICKEVFQGPVSVSCGHSFCSQCIRGSLVHLKKCPSCGEEVKEGAIRRNRALEEIVDAWDEARETILIFTKQPSGSTRKRPAPNAAINSKPSSSKSVDGVKRLKRDSDGGSRSRSTSMRPEDDARTGEGEDSDMGSDGIEELGDDDEAPCPLCAARMPISAIGAHIDRGCPPPKAKTQPNGTGNQKSDWRKVFAGAGAAKGKDVPMKKLTYPNYALSTPGDLRKELEKHGLATAGDKPALIARSQEWILLFNSNLDTSHPKSLSALRAALERAEASRKRDREKGKDAAVEELGTGKGLQQYAKEKRGEFERLRQEIIERDKRRNAQGQELGVGKDSAIEVE